LLHLLPPLHLQMGWSLVLLLCSALEDSAKALLLLVTCWLAKYGLERL
jgi:hypothetical protein